MLSPAPEKLPINTACFKVISRLLKLLDMLKDIVRANRFEVLIVSTKKRRVIEFSFLV